jgi:hypothetical protein
MSFEVAEYYGGSRKRMSRKRSVGGRSMSMKRRMSRPRSVVQSMKGGKFKRVFSNFEECAQARYNKKKASKRGYKQSLNWFSGLPSTCPTYRAGYKRPRGARTKRSEYGRTFLVNELKNAGVQYAKTYINSKGVRAPLTVKMLEKLAFEEGLIGGPE